MKMKYLFIILTLFLIICIAGTFTYKVRDSDSLVIGKKSSPRVTLTTTGISIPGTLSVTGAATFSGGSTVAGVTVYTGASIISNNLTVISNTLLSGTLNILGISIISNDLTIISNAILNGTLNILGASVISNNFDVISNVVITGTLGVTGLTTLTKNVTSYERISSTSNTDILNPNIFVSLVTTTNANNFVLSNGSYFGQTKKIILTSDGGDMTLTPVNFAEGVSLTFADQMDSVELLFDGTNWNMVLASGVTTN